MTRMRTVTRWLIQFMLLAGFCAAQQSTVDHGYFGSIFSVEGKDISEGCSRKDATGDKPFSKYVPGCLESLFRGNKGCTPHSRVFHQEMAWPWEQLSRTAS